MSKAEDPSGRLAVNLGGNIAKSLQTHIAAEIAKSNMKFQQENNQLVHKMFNLLRSHLVRHFSTRDFLRLAIFSDQRYSKTAGESHKPARRQGRRRHRAGTNARTSMLRRKHEPPRPG